MQTTKTRQTTQKRSGRGKEKGDTDAGRGTVCPILEAAERATHRDGAGAVRGAAHQRVHHPARFDRAGPAWARLNKVHGGATLPDSQFLADEPTMAAKESAGRGPETGIAKAAAALITAEDFVFLDAGTTTLALVRALSGPALEASYVTNGVAHAASAGPEGLPGVPARRAAPAPRQRPSSGRRRCRACSSTTSPKHSWGPTAWRWTQASPPRTPRKRPSRPRPSAGRGKPGSCG